MSRLLWRSFHPEAPPPAANPRSAPALLAALACALALVTACAPAAWAGGPDPLAQKADMLGNMAKFVQWPDAVMAANKGQIVVAVLGEDDLGAAIANVLSSRTVNDKPVFVRFARRPQDVRGCQIVYVAAPELSRIAELEEALRGSPTLVLADTVGFAASHGTVNFSGSPPNLRFEICLAHAQQAGLKISSRLLALAHVVEPVN